MFAVFRSGGKQHRVCEGDVVRLEKLDISPGQPVRFDEVMMAGEGEQVVLGTPFLDKGAVEGEVLAHGRHKKISVVKFKRRKGYQRKLGHRQQYTEVRITGISKHQ